MITPLEQAVHLYQEGKSAYEASRISGIGRHTIYRKLRSLGIVRSNKINSRKYQVNHHFFSSIDCESKAYWLGFIYADGFVSRTKHHQNIIGITLKDVDAIHLEKFKQDIDSTYPITRCSNKGWHNKICECARITITSEQMFDDLVAKGVVPHKSLILTFPNTYIVPKHLQHHFIRGYFDGDGSFAKHNKTFNYRACGTKEFLLELGQCIGHPNPYLYHRKRYYKNNYDLTVSGRKQVAAIGDYMYQDATIFLERKHIRYLRINRPLGKAEGTIADLSQHR